MLKLPFILLSIEKIKLVKLMLLVLKWKLTVLVFYFDGRGGSYEDDPI